MIFWVWVEVWWLVCVRSGMTGESLIDLRNKTVALSAGFRPRRSMLKYDHLVIALGSVTNFTGMPGLLEHAAADRSEVRLIGTPFSAAIDSTRLASGATISVGVRPEDMRLSDAAGTNVVTGQIEHIEKLGDASLLYVNVGAQIPLLTMKVEGTATQSIGSTVHMYCPPEALHLFDVEGDACRRTPELPT